MTSFTCAYCTILLARAANSSVERVSLKCKPAGVTVQIIAVRVFPPSDGFRICVNLHSLYGTCASPELLKALMTLPSTSKLLLMNPACTLRSPTALVVAILSEPARSTKLRVECNVGAAGSFLELRESQTTSHLSQLTDPETRYLAQRWNAIYCWCDSFESHRPTRTILLLKWTNSTIPELYLAPVGWPSPS